MPSYAPPLTITWFQTSLPAVKAIKNRHSPTPEDSSTFPQVLMWFLMWPFSLSAPLLRLFLQPVPTLAQHKHLTSREPAPWLPCRRGQPQPPSLAGSQSLELSWHFPHPASFSPTPKSTPAPVLWTSQSCPMSASPSVSEATSPARLPSLSWELGTSPVSTCVSTAQVNFADLVSSQCVCTCSILSSV